MALRRGYIRYLNSDGEVRTWRITVSNLVDGYEEVVRTHFAENHPDWIVLAVHFVADTK